MDLKVFYPRNVSSIYPRESDQQAWESFEALLDPQIKFLSGDKLPQPADYDVLVAGRPDEDMLTASPNLRTLVIPWAGLPEPTAQLLSSYPHISVHNLHHNAITTAETALMLMLTAAKLIIPIERAFRNNDWRPRYGPSQAVYLYGKTVLILGFGSIGEHVARVCQAMGMRVFGIKRDPETPLPAGLDARLYPPEALHELLPEVDVLMLTLPLTEKTRGMIGEAELGLLPQHAVLVNVGRGPVVEQGALYRALKDGKLHSAGIDVWYNYPPDEESRANTPPADYPFHELDNVVISPHRGGGSMEVDTIRLQHLAELLNQLGRDGQGPNKVNLAQGY